jgi:hypothetical protein
MNEGRLSRLARRSIRLIPVLAISLGLLGLLFSMPPVSAATAPPFNLTASPLPVNLVTKPGVSVSTPIQIENTGTDTVRIKVSLIKFGAFGSEGKPSLAQPGPHDVYISWAHFSETSFEAPPNVFHTITMTINPPKEAAFGYYYAVVFSVDNGTPTTAKPLENKVSGALATLVLLDVQAPGEKRTMSISTFSSAKKVYQFLPATFNITVKNTGNVHGIPSGNIYISRDKKNVIDLLDVNKDQGNVLPKSSRQFSTTWSDGFPVYQPKKQNGQVLSDKNGKIIQQLNWDSSKLSKLRFGRYYAHLTLIYNDGTKDIPIEAETSFWVIPWVLILIALVPILVILFGLFVMLRSFYRGTKKQTRKITKRSKKGTKTDAKTEVNPGQKNTDNAKKS